MWCPPDFRRLHGHRRRVQKIEETTYDPEIVEKINREKQTIKTGHYFLV